MKELCVEFLEVEEDLVESVVMASVYVSPILAIGSKVREELGKLAVETVVSKVDLDRRGWKLHLRIADYTVLDFYRWSTEHAENLWKGELDVGSFVEERYRKVVKDKARYWRLKKGSVEGWNFLYYIDLASLPAKKLEKDVNFKEALLKLNPHEASSGLAIEVAVAIPSRQLAQA